jgi:protein tyrosine/serine phosphatase
MILLGETMAEPNLRWKACALAGVLVMLAWRSPVRADLTIKLVAPGIYYGNAPRSESDYEQLQRLGIKTVLDMRKSAPRRSRVEQDLVSAHGMVYRRVLMGFRPTRDFTPEAALQVLADPGLRPVYMHCVLGRDRAALVAALYRVRYLGWSREAAYAAMQSERFNPFLFDLDRYFWRYAR